MDWIIAKMDWIMKIRFLLIPSLTFQFILYFLSLI